jgi:hypothetical protein
MSKIILLLCPIFMARGGKRAEEVGKRAGVVREQAEEVGKWAGEVRKRTEEAGE